MSVPQIGNVVGFRLVWSRVEEVDRPAWAWAARLCSPAGDGRRLLVPRWLGRSVRSGGRRYVGDDIRVVVEPDLASLLGFHGGLERPVAISSLVMLVSYASQDGLGCWTRSSRPIRRRAAGALFAAWTAAAWPLRSGAAQPSSLVLGVLFRLVGLGELPCNGLMFGSEPNQLLFGVGQFLDQLRVPVGLGTEERDLAVPVGPGGCVYLAAGLFKAGLKAGELLGVIQPSSDGLGSRQLAAGTSQRGGQYLACAGCLGAWVRWCSSSTGSHTTQARLWSRPLVRPT